MNKIMLIIGREYLTRVRKKSFWLLTLLTPLFMVGLISLVVYIGLQSGDVKSIQIVDESGMFGQAFKETESLEFEYVSKSIDEAKRSVGQGDLYGILYIPQIDLQNPQGISFFTDGNPSPGVIRDIESSLEKVVEDTRIKESGLSREVLAQLQADVDVAAINLEGDDEKESNVLASFGTGYIFSLLIYLFIFIYGSQIMRGVIEEKSNRIVEVIISSVKPFQLMMGKILGVAAVGLTQFLLWAVLISVLSSAASALLIGSSGNPEEFQQKMEQVNASQQNMPGGNATENLNMAAKIDNALDSINFPLIIGTFIFYFLGGYLLYAALFAAVGSAGDSETDAQQFMVPITIPLVLAIIAMGFILQEPDGGLAFWLSIIPFTSPVVMMARISYGVPEWELILSMVLLIAGFFFTTWLASRIYRVGILIHGSKVNYRVLAKWFTQGN